MGAKCLSETLVLAYKKIRYHNQQQKSQNKTHQPILQESQISTMISISHKQAAMLRLHTLFTTAYLKQNLSSLQENI
jgi:hypothetical protein